MYMISQTLYDPVYSGYVIATYRKALQMLMLRALLCILIWISFSQLRFISR